jgi:uncharacterized protein (TIGR03437 family)
MCIVRLSTRVFIFAALLFGWLPARAQAFVYAVSVPAITTGAVQTSAFSFQFSTPTLLTASTSDPVHVERQPAFSLTGAPQSGYELQDGVLNVAVGSLSLAFRNPAGNMLFFDLSANPAATFNAVGTYGLRCVPTLSSGTIILAGDAAGGGTLTIATGATVPPPLIKSVGSLTFLYVPGNQSPTAVVLLSSPGVNLPFTVSTSGDPWLLVSANGPTTPAVLTVTIVPFALAPMTYNATIFVNAPGAANPSDNIPVNLTVLPPQQQGPIVLQVSNSASYAPSAAPNGGVAQGSLFVAFGFYMGPATLARSDYPLPPSLAGTSVKIAVGSTSVDALMVYTSPSQLAAILPSKTPAGAGTITVTYNGVASSPIPITVAANSFGTYSVSSNGQGPGVITGADFRLKTSASPAKPGETVILWGTGLGPITGDESQRPTPANQFTPAVFIGNQPGKVSYAGRSSCCAGLDQINVVVPSGIEGCFVPVAVQSGAVVSGFTSLPISSSGACSDTVGIAPSLLARAETGSNINLGAISVGPLPVLQFLGFPLYQNAARSLSMKLSMNIEPQDLRKVVQSQPSERRAVMAEMRKKYRLSTPAQLRRVQTAIRELTSENSQGAAASFFALSNLAAVTPQFASLFPPPGTCTVFQSLPTTARGSGPLSRNLDAGTELTLSSPSGNLTLAKAGKGTYQVLIGSGVQAPIGSYRIAGSGGHDVGSFSATLNVNNTLQWLNKSAISSVDRTQSLTITWSGGPSPGHVMFGGFADVPGGGVFLCVEDSQKGMLTLPPYVLAVLPQTSSSRGYLFLGTHPFENTFTAPGLDVGYFANFSTDSRVVEFR